MSHQNKQLYEFLDFRLDVSECLLLKKGRRVQISDRTFKTLCALVRRGGQLVTKDELMAEVWVDAIVEENNLDKNISVLRQALGEQKGKVKFIETVRGRGYRFLPEIRRIEMPAQANNQNDFGKRILDFGIQDNKKTTPNKPLAENLKQNPRTANRNRGRLLRWQSGGAKPLKSRAELI